MEIQLVHGRVGSAVPMAINFFVNKCIKHASEGSDTQELAPFYS